MDKDNIDGEDERCFSVLKEDNTGYHFAEETQGSYFSNVLSFSHINILLGAGFSSESVPVLGFREEWSERLDDVGEASGDTARKLLTLEFFESILTKMTELSPSEAQRRFCRDLKRIMQTRGTTTIPKRACIFTTNYDPCVELSLEMEGCVFNDGFEGRDSPRFATRSFSRLQYTQSLSMEYTAQVPTINVVKLHGSTTWRKEENQTGGIVYSGLDERIKCVREKYPFLLDDKHIAEAFEYLKSKPTDGQVRKMLDIANTLEASSVRELADFFDIYSEAFCLVNPTKKKFADTVLGLTYYELLRLYANELDRNNALLIVFGFSFNDEHVAEITKRALENPQLLLLICCYSKDDYKRCSARFKVEQNVRFLVSKEENGHIDLDALCDLFEGVTDGR